MEQVLTSAEVSAGDTSQRQVLVDYQLDGIIVGTGEEALLVLPLGATHRAFQLEIKTDGSTFISSTTSGLLLKCVPANAKLPVALQHMDNVMMVSLLRNEQFLLSVPNIVDRHLSAKESPVLKELLFLQ